MPLHAGEDIKASWMITVLMACRLGQLEGEIRPLENRRDQMRDQLEGFAE